MDRLLKLLNLSEVSFEDFNVNKSVLWFIQSLLCQHHFQHLHYLHLHHLYLHHLHHLHFLHLRQIHAVS